MSLPRFKTISLTPAEAEVLFTAIHNRMDDLLNRRPVELEEVDLLDDILEQIRED